jgi:predicted nucleotidyltransferase
MTIENVIEILRAVTGDTLYKYKAQVKGIFGSFARGEESESSDIDIFVDFKEGADLFDLVGLSLFLEEKLKRHVDIVPTDTIKSDVRNVILKEAIYI